MKFLLVATALLGAATAMPNLAQRDVTTMNSSVNTVSSSVTKLQGTVKSFQPSGLTTISGIYAIQDDANQLQKDLQSAVNAMSGQQLSILDSLQLLISRVAFEGVLIPYLLFMISMKPTFDNIFGVFSIRKTILAILQTEDSLTQQMDEGIEAIMNPFVAYGMKALALAEHAAFEATEAVYQIPAPAGKIELPAGQIPDPSTIPSAVTGAV